MAALPEKYEPAISLHYVLYRSFLYLLSTAFYVSEYVCKASGYRPLHRKNRCRKLHLRGYMADGCQSTAFHLRYSAHGVSKVRGTNQSADRVHWQKCRCPRPYSKNGVLNRPLLPDGIKILSYLTDKTAYTSLWIK